MAHAHCMLDTEGYKYTHTHTHTHTHTQVVCYSLLSHGNNGCTNAPQCYVIRTLPVLFVYPCVTLDFCPSAVVSLVFLVSVVFLILFSLLIPFGPGVGENRAVHRKCHFVAEDQPMS
jgi:hypothetical protein